MFKVQYFLKHALPVLTGKYNMPFPMMFDDSLSQLEKMNKIISWIHETSKEFSQLIDDVNDVLRTIEIDMNEVLDEFEKIKTEMLPENVNIILNEWFNDGKLAQIINENVFDMKTNVSDSGLPVELKTKENETIVDGVNNLYDKANSYTIYLQDFGSVVDGQSITSAMDNALTHIYTLVGSGSVLNGDLVSKGIKLFIPYGTYFVDKTIETKGIPVIIEGMGQSQTVISPSTPFNGTTIFRFGTTSTGTYTQNIQLKNIGINLKNTPICAIEMYGCRDGSSIEDVLITGGTSTTIRTGLSGTTGTIMNQGVLFKNVHSLSGANIGTPTNIIPIWDISGMYEASFINCKVLGQSQALQYVIGIEVGRTATSRGVSFYGCSVGGVNNTENDLNIGILLSQADKCYINNCTLEMVKGYPIQFGTDTKTATNCSAINNRFYNPGVTIYSVYNIRFMRANGCDARLQTATSQEKYVRFDTNAVSCRVEASHGAITEAALKGMYQMASTNIVTGLWSGNFFVLNGSGDLSLAIGTNNTNEMSKINVVRGLEISNPSTNSLSMQVDNALEKTTFNHTVQINTGKHLRFGNNFLWVDAEGKLRIKGSLPNSDTDGVVVGTQS